MRPTHYYCRWSAIKASKWVDVVYLFRHLWGFHTQIYVKICSTHFVFFQATLFSAIPPQCQRTTTGEGGGRINSGRHTAIVVGLSIMVYPQTDYIEKPSKMTEREGPTKVELDNRQGLRANDSPAFPSTFSLMRCRLTSSLYFLIKDIFMNLYFGFNSAFSIPRR